MGKEKYRVAILGATGAVGTRMIQQLEQSTIPVGEIRLLASARSAGKTLSFNGKSIVVEEARPESFDGIDLVLASAGGSISARLLPEAVKRGAVCVDNTSYFRMNDQVPLVVPEVNEKDLAWHHGIIANPNCSTIQMVMALEPVRQKYGLTRVIVSTYQAAGGAGQSAIDELEAESQAYLNRDSEKVTPAILPVKGDTHHYQLAFNLLPQIDVFEADGYTHEEWKMIHETKKIMLGDKNSPEIKVTATCVRVPVSVGHGESVWFEVADQQKPTIAQLHQSMAAFPGLVVVDDPASQLYPQPKTAEGRRETFVGRVRPDLETPGAYNLWVVADNLLKGAAWNSVQIAERLVADDLVRVPEGSAALFATATE